MGQNLIKKLDSPSHCVQSFLNFANQFQILILKGLGNMKKNAIQYIEQKFSQNYLLFFGSFLRKPPLCLRAFVSHPNMSWEFESQP